MRLAVTTGVLCLVFSPHAQLLAEGYRFTTIDYPDSEWTELHGINAKERSSVTTPTRRACSARSACATAHSKRSQYPNSPTHSWSMHGASTLVVTLSSTSTIVTAIPMDTCCRTGRFQRIEPPGAMLTILEEGQQRGRYHRVLVRPGLQQDPFHTQGGQVPHA
jgi:hypothetical protein